MAPPNYNRGRSSAPTSQPAVKVTFTDTGKTEDATMTYPEKPSFYERHVDADQRAFNSWLFETIKAGASSTYNAAYNTYDWLANDPDASYYRKIGGQLGEAAMDFGPAAAVKMGHPGVGLALHGANVIRDMVAQEADLSEATKLHHQRRIVNSIKREQLETAFGGKKKKSTH